MQPRLTPKRSTGAAALKQPPAATTKQGGEQRPGVLKTAAGLLVALGMAAALLFGGSPGAGHERNHPNWTHVDAASRGNGPALQHVGVTGAATLVDEIILTDDDVDIATTTSIRDAIVNKSPVEIERTLQDAQEIRPPALQDDAVVQEVVELQRTPTLAPGLHEAIVQGDIEFFHIHLFDSCAEDGDVVEVIINGTSFAVVPISHAGATLSVPLPQTGASTLAIRGIRDGGGGITVACRTSQGAFFSRVMGVGEIQPLHLLRP